MASVTGIFLVDTDRTMCPGVNSASKNDYQGFPWGKDGRCVRLTTYHPCSAERQEIRSLNLPGPPWAISTACCGRDLYLYQIKILRNGLVFNSKAELMYLALFKWDEVSFHHH